MISTLFLAAMLSAPAEPVRSIIQLRSGARIEAVGPVHRDGSRTIFNSGSRTFSVATDEIVSITLASSVAPARPPASRGETVEVSAQTKTSGVLRVDPATATRILSAIAPAAPDSQAARTGALPAPVSHPPPSPDTPDPADEHYWRERWREATDRLTYAREELELLQRREQRLNDEILGLLSLGYHESEMGRQAWQLQNTRDQIERAKLEITRAERDLSRVLHDARREGVYPSWLRE